MRKEIIDFINRNQELKQFIREQPQWYRTLSRNPEKIQTMQIASMHHNRRTIPHKVEKFTNGVQMASMMMHMFQMMNSNS
ncbi:hypothetical protein C0971_05785 [Bacillus methanolicus]|uniref:YlbE-like family protein n=1 Tax=Bacillus methanolicus TaxID=1471 RepID=UPI00200CFCDC|nr:YlbE-like family protein [Bacillus methanolicus]UQD51589.1 hypothetical protein C0971_05785 [Bacillus methanolicus]